MSALTVYQGLEARFRTIAGIRGIRLGEPTGDQDLPAIYIAYQSFDRPIRSAPPARNLSVMTHVFGVRLCLRWVDWSAAEMELLTLLDAIPDAIDADPRLGGILAGGSAACESGISGYATIGEVTYRIVDYTITVKDGRSG